MRLLDGIDKLLGWMESGVIVALSTAALGLGVMQVVLRYAFNTGFPWTEALFVNLTIWAMLFGGSRAVRDGVHVRVDVLAMLLPPWPARVLDLVGLLVSLALTSFYFYCGLQFVLFVHRMGSADIETHIPDAVTYAIVPIAMGAFALRYVILLVRWAREPRARGSGAPADADRVGL